MINVTHKSRSGYTRAQQQGLARSTEIKKKRKEEERAFEREKMAFEASESAKGRASKERMESTRIKSSAMEGALGREASVTSATAQAEAATALQQQRGQQAYGLQEMRGEQTAVQKSMDARRRLSEAEASGAGGQQGRVEKFTSIGGQEGFYNPATGKTSYPAEPGGGLSTGEQARAGLQGPDEEKSLTGFMDMDREGQAEYIEQLKKKNPSALKSLKKQYELLYRPEPEDDRAGSDFAGAGDIYQSSGGTFRNY